jgi:hypothetical protein
MNKLSSAPVFYDIEASGLDGFPIEIGWARADLASDTVLSEGHLIRPSADWDVRGTWDASAATRHRIPLDELWRTGKPVFEIARRMNETLRGTELFADSPFNESWLQQLFEAAGLEPEFVVRRTDAAVLIKALVGDRAVYAEAKRQALRIAPPTHRAEADARHWAVLWAMVARPAPPRTG